MTWYWDEINSYIHNYLPYTTNIYWFLLVLRIFSFALYNQHTSPPTGIMDWSFSYLYVQSCKSFNRINHENILVWQNSSVVECLPKDYEVCGSSLCHGILLWRWALHLQLAPDVHISIMPVCTSWIASKIRSKNNKQA